MPQYDVALTITFRDAQPEDVRGFLANLQELVGPGGAVIEDAGTKRHLHDVQRAGERALGTFVGPWRHQRQRALEALRETQGDIAAAAQKVGVSEQTMRDYAARLGFTPRALQAAPMQPQDGAA